MGLDKGLKLEELSRNLWRSYCKNQIMEPSSWLQFFSLFFNSQSLEQFAFSSDQTLYDLFPLCKIKNLVIFLNTNGHSYKTILRETPKLLDQLGFSQVRGNFVVVLNPSITGLEIIFISPQYEKSVRTVKILRLPQGQIPAYFQELIESGCNESPLVLFQRLIDKSALKADFLNRWTNSFPKSKEESEKHLIAYLTLLLILSGFINVENWFEKHLRQSRIMTLRNCMSKIQEFNSQQSVINDDLRTISTYLNELNLMAYSINLSLLQEFLTRFSFSLNEPTIFIQELAITPLFLSEITENLTTSSSRKKKLGKFYTHLHDADFVSYLTVYRMLRIKIPDITSDDLFNLIYQGWGFETVHLTKSINQSSMSPLSLEILDPTCGSGTFLLSVVRLLSQLILSGLTPQNVKVKLWGIDNDSHAVMITQLRLILLRLQHSLRKLMVNSTECSKNPVQLEIRIISTDFFFHDFSRSFDLILGNPPWVRHEDIGIGQSDEYKKLLQNRIIEKSGKNLFFDRKSDLYIYFCMMGLLLLKPGGVLAFLTSNAWLEVKYGRTLQTFLLDRVNIFEIIQRSGTRLWDELGINSIVIIAEKSITLDNKCSSGVFTETNSNFSQIPLESLREGIIPRRVHEDRYYRTECIRREQLAQTNKWAGTFLRTSRNEREVLQMLNERGVPLSTIASVRFGIKTGANDFFHLKRRDKEAQNDGLVFFENRVGYSGQIEEKYLVPLIKSPTHISGFVVQNSFKSQIWLFNCLDSPERLQGSMAWKYIKWGETTNVMIKQGQKSGTNIQGFPSIRSLQQRGHWYSLPKYPTPDLLWTKSYHDKPSCLFNQAQAIPDQRFYGIKVSEKKHLPLIFTYLNSSLVWAQMEAQGNTNMGYGVLDTNVYWLKSIKIPIKALEEKNNLDFLMKRLIKEKSRVSMFKFSQKRADIDQFFAKYFDLSENSLELLNAFNSRSLKNRILPS